MKMYLHPKHWQDLASGLLGVWLVLAPWALGFSRDSMAMSNSLVMGLALVAVSIGAVVLPQAWEEWTEAALGLWMAASPWLLGFTHLPAANLNAFATGMAVLCFALWVLATDKDYASWLADRPT